jgi:hypothetical protein
MKLLRITRVVRARYPAWAAAAVALALPLAARAVPDDFRVLTDELTDHGETALEVQGSVGSAGSNLGASRQRQGLVEISYGLTENLEVSLQFLGSQENGQLRGNGVNLESQYIGPHDADQGFYWGARTELGRGRSFGEVHSIFSLEARPIVGYRFGKWHAVLNAGLRKPLSGADRHISWEPSAKLKYRFLGHNFLGAEYYVQAGQHGVVGPDGFRRKLGLLVVDTRLGAMNLNLGLGRGMNVGGDGTVLKAVVGFDIK